LGTKLCVCDHPILCRLLCLPDGGQAHSGHRQTIYQVFLFFINLFQISGSVIGIAILAYHLLNAICLVLREDGIHDSWKTVRELMSTHRIVSVSGLVSCQA